jgi:hypothetical protein
MASENKLFKFYEELPSYGKAIALIGGLVIVYVGYNKINSIIGSLKASADAAARAKTIDADIASKSATQKASYSQDQYNGFADAIEATLSGCDFSISATAIGILGNDASKIYNTVLTNINNDIDFLNLQKAFGVRTIPKSIYCGYTSDVNGDLVTVMTRILNTQEINYLNSYLAGKGINYKI